jgi:reducing polyketide synthase SwnK
VKKRKKEETIATAQFVQLTMDSGAQDISTLKDKFNAADEPTMLGYTLHQFYERATDSHPHKTALICAEEQLTFQDLNTDANRLARILIDRGVERGNLVGVALERSVDLVVAFLAILKTGAAYLPIEPSMPAQRVSYMIDDARPKLVIVHYSTLAALSPWKDLCLVMNSARDDSSANPSNLEVNTQTENLAYVIYTSGSTGRPKGVEISHNSVCNLLLSMRREPGCMETDRLLAVTTASFDIAVLELFLPLFCGGMTVIAQAHQVIDGDALLRLMRQHAITMMQGTPAHWQLLLDSGWRGEPRLAKILCGGEALSRQLAERLLKCGDSVWNMYGPTETTVWSSVWKVREGEDIVIGKPIANTWLLVLDTDLSPLPIGVEGELYIGGAGVARGYRNKPELTKSRFIDNPFNEGRLYRTGDLARFVTPEKLVLLGRADSQIKLRGHRIELGDIETAITDHEDISSAVVICRDERLIAYCVWNNPIVDEDKPVHGTTLANWASAWDRVYAAGDENTIFNLAGWRNSYDNLPFPADEMRDWQMSSVRRILSYTPERVFEIGSGTGLMLFSIAPHCQTYHAVDTSENAVEFIRQHISEFHDVVCEHRPAHELPEGLENTFDTVIINSVAQYFPSIHYLVTVLEWATKIIDNGRIYLGDMRDLRLLDIFHADLIDYRCNGQVSTEQLARRASHSMESEHELVVSPDFFANLPSLIPRIHRVDIALRDGSFINEMTRYRFDVILHIGKGADAHVCDAERTWREDQLDITSLREVLATTNSIRISDIPNGRLQAVHHRVAAALGDAMGPSPSSWIDPQDLFTIAADCGLEMAMLPSRSGDRWNFDARFWRGGEDPDLSLHPAQTIDLNTLAGYSNVPVIWKSTNSNAMLSRTLRPWLAARLPAYMMPAFFVELESLPLTLNRKVDRNALPDPTSGATITTKPTTELQRDILNIWSNVLGHDSIGVDDNFFQVGGDSLRAIHVQTELEKLLQQPVPVAKLFEHYTVKALAAYLVGTDMATTEKSVPPRRKASSIEEDIAIISMACKLPGGVTTPEGYWEMLLNGNSGITDVPRDRWDADAVYNPDAGIRGRTYCRQGGFVDSIDSFDASFFNISPREARALDPSQRIMLETCWEAFERAGYTMSGLRGSQTGAYIGISRYSAYRDYGSLSAQNLAALDGYAATGSAGSTISGRLSYTFGLEGPALSVDTACSSSLVSTHLACNALRQGECDLAVAGGVTVMLSPDLYVEFSQLGGMSRDGRCRAFAADTEGTGWAEGCAVILLKRLSDAQQDGDPIHAVLRGTTVNHNGRSANLTAPSGPAQQRLILSALATSGLQPSGIDYVEAHGTGTKLGDPIEGTALAEVFGGSHSNEKPLWIGSVKSNIGHTQAAAGLAGLMKVVLAMQHNILPSTLHAATPTAAVDWRTSGIALIQEKQPWPQKKQPRRAGVSSFGIGGTNAHAIVEEAPRQTVKVEPSSSQQLPHAVPILISGRTDVALRQQARNLRRHIELACQIDLGDLAFSLVTTRSHFHQRVALMVQDKTELMENLMNVERSSELPAGIVHNGDHDEKPHLAMMFTGQGSQTPSMGRSLCKAHPIFQDTLQEISAEFTGLEVPLLDVMWADPGSTAADLLDHTEFAQPALFALEVALWRLWQSWDVNPELVFGHSVGELAAAHVAGVFDLPDACRLVAARGRLMQALPSRGGMVVVEASDAEVREAIEALSLSSKVKIAGYNTPTQTVISGDANAIESVSAQFTSNHRKVKALKVSHAFHSYQMDGMLADFQAIATTVQFHPPKLAVVSGLTGKLAEVGELERPEYWVCQVREAVRFSSAIQTLHNHGINLFVELGPKPVLSGMGSMCLADEPSIAWIPSLIPGRDDSSTVQRSLTELHVRHVPVSWPTYFKPFGCKRVALPTYAFQRERFWFDPKPPSHADSDGTGLPSACMPSVDRFQFEICWQQTDVDSDQPRGSWGLLCPAGYVEWALEIQASLERAGIQVLEIGALEEVRELTGLLCLWDSEQGVPFQAQSLTAEALAQLQAATRIGFAPQVVWATRHAVGTAASDAATGLGAAPLWGLMRTARNEHPELRLRMIDLGEGKADVESFASALMLEAEPECAVRDAEVLVPRMRQVEWADGSSVPKLPVKQLLRPGGAVLITGGLGFIGQHVARWLVTTHKARDLVLTSRRGAGSPGAKEFIDELTKLGAKATIVASDIGDFDSISSVMQMFDEGRPLRAIVHAAGSLNDGVLSALTPQRCDTVFRPKVDGAWHLHQLTQDKDLDLFIMFSSISGTMGTPGQGNYAAANTFLDALAHLRCANGLPAISVAWGGWKGHGMLGSLGEIDRARFAKMGLNSLAPEEGLQLFELAARSGRALVVAAALDTKQLQSYVDDRGEVSSLLLSLLGKRRTQDRVEEGWDLRRALSRAPLKQHEAIMLDTVQEAVAKSLGFTSKSEVNISLPLQEIGIDSLTSIMIRNHLAKLTNLTLSAKITFDHSNLKALSHFLLSQLHKATNGTSTSSNDVPAPAEPGTGTTATAATSAISSLNMAQLRKGCLDSDLTFSNVACGAIFPQSVLVTGATGFVGSFILRELLDSNITTYCLVRADSLDRATRRLTTTLTNYGLWKPDYAPLLNPILGDVSQPLLGLDEKMFDHLASQVDAICHSASLVNWMRPLDDYISPNVLSTHEVLRLASRGKGKAVHLISTAATLPKYLGHEIAQGNREYGYATSKWMAEQIVAAARWRGAKASVYRLPFVTASARTGHFRLDRGDFLHNMIVGGIQMGSFPSLAADLSAVLPIDYLSRTITSVMTKDLSRQVGQDFDFLNMQAPSFNDFFQLMCAASGGQAAVVPFSQWMEQALAYAAARPTSSIARIAAVLDGLTEQSATDMVKALPVGKHVFGGEEYPVPSMGEQFVQKYLDCIRQANK